MILHHLVLRNLWNREEMELLQRFIKLYIDKEQLRKYYNGSSSSSNSNSNSSTANTSLAWGYIKYQYVTLWLW
jgi:hypothetical protein